ncbi:MAG: hypothetical protein U9R79_09400 [Armatimonadota bacterium]|nr:hypothetical protein [Armatimonadota bacterium]
MRLQLGGAPRRYVGPDIAYVVVALAGGGVHDWQGWQSYRVIDDRE